MVIIIIINSKDHRLNSGSDSRPIIGSDFGANIGPQLSSKPRSIIGPISIANIASLGRSSARSYFPTWVIDIFRVTAPFFNCLQTLYCQLQN